MLHARSWALAETPRSAWTSRDAWRTSCLKGVHFILEGAQVRALLANKNYFARGCHLHTGRATLRTRITAVGSRGRDGACALRRRTARHRPWCSTPTSASCASTIRHTASERSAGRRRPMRRCACCALCATRRSAATAAAPWWARAAAHVESKAKRLRGVLYSPLAWPRRRARALLHLVSSLVSSLVGAHR